MLAISAYIRAITGASLISAVVLRLLAGKGSAASIGKILVGIFMALTVISPIAQVELSDLWNLIPDVTADASQATADGLAAAKKALAEGISTRVEAYILDKAAQMGVSLTVRIALSDDAIPVPQKVWLQGNVSPYAKSRLQTVMEQELGIDKENQIWT